MVESVNEFFKGQSVLITGGTGFLGKAVIEKLLRSCPEVNCVYVIIRSKAGSQVRERLEELLKNPLFDTLKGKNPMALKKIIPIEGDISSPFLGIQEDDRIKLISDVTVVIHSAATVKFDENLVQSIELNVNGTRRIVRLCKDLKHLKALVHVSTAYSNCDQKCIQETVYPPPHGAVALLEGLTGLKSSSSRVEKDSKNILITGKRPNTYTYTKALAEHILIQEAGGLPVCIVRPSIVTASWQEPVPGWIDNVNGATGLIAGAGIGIMRVLLSEPSNVINIVPVDVVVNLILCAAWETSLQQNRSNPPKVYNCCAPKENSVQYKELVEMGLKDLRITSPFSKAFWYPSLTLTPSRFWYTVNDLLFQYLPAMIVDVFLSTFTWARFRMLKMYWKLKRATRSLEFFTMNNWIFSTDNVAQLFKSLSVEDQKRFYFNVHNINWQAYIKQYCLGIRRFILKESDSTVNSARSRLIIIYWIRALFTFLALFTFGFNRSESIFRHSYSSFQKIKRL